MTVCDPGPSLKRGSVALYRATFTEHHATLLCNLGSGFNMCVFIGERKRANLVSRMARFFHIIYIRLYICRVRMCVVVRISKYRGLQVG